MRSLAAPPVAAPAGHARRYWEPEADVARSSSAYHAAWALLERGVYPTPSELKHELGASRWGPINSRQNAGRRQALRDAGWTQARSGVSWKPPA